MLPRIGREGNMAGPEAKARSNGGSEPHDGLVREPRRTPARRALNAKRRAAGAPTGSERESVSCVARPSIDLTPSTWKSAVLVPHNRALALSRDGIPAAMLPLPVQHEPHR